MEQEDKSNKPGGNKIFEDYGSNYGSYGDEDDHYEDLVGVDDLDDDWHFEREPREQPEAKAEKEYKVKQDTNNGEVK